MDTVVDGDKASWVRVGRAISARIATLGLLKTEVQKTAGVSDKTLNGYIAGKPIVLANKRRGLCAALRWAPDSIDRLLRGEDPVELADEPSPDLAEDVKILRQQVSHLIRLVENLGTLPGAPRGGDGDG